MDTLAYLFSNVCICSQGPVVLFPGQRMDAIISAPDSRADRLFAVTIKFDEE